MTQVITQPTLFSTAINVVEQTQNVSHQANYSAEEFAVKVAEYMLTNNTTVTATCLALMTDAIKHPSFKLNIGGSIFNSFEGNSLAMMVEKSMKVFFGVNLGMIRGTAIHHGREISVRHKIETGNLLPFMDCLKEMRIIIEDKWKYLNPKVIGKVSKADVYLEVARAFKVYYTESLVNSEDIEVEKTYNEEFPLEIFTNPVHAKHFRATATYDSIAKRVENGKEIFIMVDTKSTTSKISGSVEMDEKLKTLIDKKRLFNEEMTALEKTIKKFINSKVKLNEANDTFKEVEAKLEFARANAKATTQLEKRLLKWETEVQKWTENLQLKEKAEKQIAIYNIEIDELEELSKPLYEIYKDEKYEADLLDCKLKHETQLAYCSVLELMKTGRKISKLRIENVVMHKVKVSGKSVNKPYVQIFEWDIDDSVLDAVDEKVETLIHSVEAIMDGIDSKIIFRPSKHLFYGSEFEDLLLEIKEMVKNKRELEV